MLWGLLSRVPGTPAHRTYQETLEVMDSVRGLLERQYPEAGPLPGLPAPPRSPGACAFSLEAMCALIDATDGVRRGVSLEEALALLEEHMPTAVAR